jgi:uncharacterized membrane protein
MKKIEIAGVVIFILALVVAIIFAFMHKLNVTMIAYPFIVVGVILLIAGSKIIEMVQMVKNHFNRKHAIA